MIQTIRLGHVLRETVATPYRNLVTRPTGVAVRGRIEATLARSACRTALLDFSEVDLLDFSCADEVIAKLLLAREPAREPYVVLQGLGEAHTETIAHVLTHHRLAVLAVMADEGCDLLGWVPADARAAFAEVVERGAAVAETLAGRLDWPLRRAAEALDALAEHRLVRRVDVRFEPLKLA